MAWSNKAREAAVLARRRRGSSLGFLHHAPAKTMSARKFRKGRERLQGGRANRAIMVDLARRAPWRAGLWYATMGKHDRRAAVRADEYATGNRKR